MHWLFPKKTAKATTKANVTTKATRPVRPRMSRISVPRPAPKTRPKTRTNTPVRAATRKAKPPPNRNSVMKLKLKKQIEEMKQMTNKLKQANENRHDLIRFTRNGIPQPRKQNPNDIKEHHRGLMNFIRNGIPQPRKQNPNKV